MSVLIKGMKKPDHCLRCPFMVSRDNDDCILQTEEENSMFKTFEAMKEHCPLVEVPETHGRLVDIGDVKKAIFDYHGEDEQKIRTMINAILSSVPTVIEAEVGE